MTRTRVARKSGLFAAWRAPVRTALTRCSAGRLPAPLLGARHHSNAAMIATLLTAKTQNGTERPAQAMANPPSAGPAARPMLKPAPFKAVAPSRSSLGTSIGVIAPQAGDVSAPPTPSKKVVASKSVGVARPTETKPAKATETVKIAVSTAMSNRLESRTSASAPCRQSEKEQREADGNLYERDHHWTRVDACYQPARRGVEHSGADIGHQTHSPYDGKS